MTIAVFLYSVILRISTILKLNDNDANHKMGATPKYGHPKRSYLKMNHNRDCGCSKDISRSLELYQGTLLFEIG